jgi:hypothetical protein
MSEKPARRSKNAFSAKKRLKNVLVFLNKINIKNKFMQCLIHDNSLRFSRATYGVLTLISVIIHNPWLILIVSLLIILGAFSLKLNLPYQFHVLVIKRMASNKTEPILKDKGEINFVAGMTGILLLIGFLLIYLGKFVNFAWIYILVVDMLIFLACFVGFCVATLMYIFFKKLFKDKDVKSEKI